ncbi:MAG: hypothetical protein P9L91_08715 [Candidatus Zophobacter franzmannii]|jgi:hypothetical protein|nr:hypothetical protein [Candidatus Zophobacter franzmannii]
MKQTTKEIQIQKRMQLGNISADGFLGKDKRHYLDIIAEDENKILELDYTIDQIADRLEELTAEAFKSPEGPTNFGTLTLDYFSYRGKVTCPFADPGVYAKAKVTARNTENDVQLCWTPLNIHLIRKHHFFEGKGAEFRLDPEQLIKCIF